MVTGTGSVARDTDDHALSTYLERHLSGSDVAVRLVDGLHGRASNQEERDFLERFSRELEDERPDPQTPPEVPPEPNEPIQERPPGRNDPEGEEIGPEAPLA